LYAAHQIALVNAYRGLYKSPHKYVFTTTLAHTLGGMPGTDFLSLYTSN